MAESEKEATTATATATATAAADELGSGPPHEDEDALLARAHTVISRILDRELDPNPRLLHTLATMCELHEARSVLLCLTLPLPSFLFLPFKFCSIPVSRFSSLLLPASLDF
jgi:HIV-1 Vpr-binding protein